MQLYLVLEFLIGQALHIIKRCDLIVQSKTNTTNDMRLYVKRYGVSVIFQLAVGAAFFSGVLANVSLLGRAWPALAPFVSYRWNAGSAFIAGLIFDNALDWAMERYPIVRRLLNGNFR